MDHPAWNLLICADCHEVVWEDEVLLENSMGEVVYPPDKELVALYPKVRVKRNRRKPTEADPVGYRLILPRRGR